MIDASEAISRGIPQIIVESNFVLIRRISSGAIKGFIEHFVNPGETYQGWTYQELRDLKGGFHDLKSRHKTERVAV